MNEYEVIMAVKKTKSAKKKIKLFKDNMTKELKYILVHVTSPYVSFGIDPESYEMAQPIKTKTVVDEKWALIAHVLYKLSTRSYPSPKEAIEEVSVHLNKRQQFILDLILCKDLCCGLTNEHICQELELLPGFQAQTAKSTPAGMNYPCIAELNRAGIRNISIVNIDTVSHYSPSGIPQPQFSFLDRELLNFSAGAALIIDGTVHGVCKDAKKSLKMAETCKKTKELRYTVSDMMPMGAWARKGCGSTQIKRSVQLVNFFEEYHGNPNVEDTQIFREIFKGMENSKDAKAFLNKAIKRGHNSIILKSPDHTYSFCPTSEWQIMEK